MGAGTDRQTREWMAQCRDVSAPLSTGPDLDRWAERLAQSRLVLLGEASHGTSDYYLWRFRLTKRLIERHGFSLVAVEGDWPDCMHLNRYVKARPGSGHRASQVLHAFERWPTWMWGNWEVVQLAEWLRQVNQKRPEARRAGFFGLDVYSLWDSQQAVVDYLDQSDPALARQARAAYGCFDPFQRDVQTYAYATLSLSASCADEVVAVLTRLRERQPQLADGSDDAYFEAEQNALVVQNAERYYRSMIHGGPDSWNIRDRHMMETLTRLLDHHGPASKAIVWAHNTHIGDARYTDMQRSGEVNIGQLARESGISTTLVGFGSYQGSVMAAYAWGDRMCEMLVPEARSGSVEGLLHEVLPQGGWLWLGNVRAGEPLSEVRGHRAIGVVYNPAYERFGNYVATQLAHRYDAFVFIDQTRALHPLRLHAHAAHEPPETFPWAV